MRGEEVQDRARAPAAPVIAASQPDRAPGRRRFRLARPRADHRDLGGLGDGHRPQAAARAGPVSPMNSSAKHAPATRPAATPAAGRPGAIPPGAGRRGAITPGAGRSAVVAPGRWLALRGRDRLLAAAGRAGRDADYGGQREDDAGEGEGDGRSPRSSPASTENPAAPTALSGPATLNAACRNPR